jgi:hypothetical protein
MKRLTKQDIKAVKDRPIIEFPVPEWGGSVLLRGLSSTARDAWEKECSIAKKNGDELPNMWRAKFVRCGIVGDDGKPMFEENELRELSDKSTGVIDTLFGEVAKLSHMTKETVEELEKNSESRLKDNSGSNSVTATESLLTTSSNGLAATTSPS